MRINELFYYIVKNIHVCIIRYYIWFIVMVKEKNMLDVNSGLRMS